MVKPAVDLMQNYRPTPNRIFDLYNYYQGIGPTTGTPTTTTASIPGYNPFIPRGGGEDGGGITSISPQGFRQTDNLFQAQPVAYENELSFQGKVPGMDIPAINFKDAPVDLRLAQNNPRVFDPVVNIKNAMQNINFKKARELGLKGVSSSLLSRGGAQLGFRTAGILGAGLGAIGGGILGLGARGLTDAEKVVSNFYGNQGTPGFYVDPITGELVKSEMQGYNISSAFGRGIPAAIDKRLARIARTITKRKGNVTQGLLDLRERLEKEKAAIEAEQQRQAKNLQDANRAAGTGGYQSSFASDTDFMEGDKSAGGRATTATMGST